MYKDYVLRVLIIIEENCDQNKNFGKIMDMKTMILGDYHVEMLIGKVKQIDHTVACMLQSRLCFSYI